MFNTRGGTTVTRSTMCSGDWSKRGHVTFIAILQTTRDGKYNMAHSKQTTDVNDLFYRSLSSYYPQCKSKKFTWSHPKKSV